MSEDTLKLTPPQKYLIEGRIRRKSVRFMRKLFFKQLEHNWSYRGKEYGARIQIFVPEPTKDFPEPRIFFYVSFMEWHVLIPIMKLEDYQAIVEELNDQDLLDDLEDKFREAVSISNRLK